MDDADAVALTVAGGVLSGPTGELRAAIGRGGVRADKREGDGATPAGTYPLLHCYYRPDRLARPRSGLVVTALSPEHGWCDDPGDRHYNRLVTLPYPASAERIWRADGLYDLVVVIGHNTDPVVPGAGSAIFLHVAGPDFAATEGCVAIARDDFVALLARLGPGSTIAISA